MSSSSVSASPAERPASTQLVRWLFIATLFTSAGLLFMVQPMFGRMALPILGGAPAVWNVAMVFFQIALLAGYFYAHVLSRLAFQLQLVIHTAVLAAAALMLPVSLDANSVTPDTSMPTLWLLGLMLETIGLPFFAISAQAPLMQRWFARSSDTQAADPYFLYAASNIGSILGLVAYPAIMEPLFTVTTHALLWTLGFVLLLAFVVCAGLTIMRSRAGTTQQLEATSQIGWKTQLHWVALAAVPSGLLLSVTNNLTTDIAAVPLMWAPPLLAYLLSFVVAFAPPKWLTPHVVRQMAPCFVIGLAIVGLFAEPFGIAGSITAQVFLYFGVALACHVKLVAARPAADRLTHFYLLMSLGGAVGGALVALLAPTLFDWVFEHPMLIVASALLLARSQELVTGGRIGDILTGARHGLLWDIVFGFVALALAMSIVGSGGTTSGFDRLTSYQVPVLLLIVMSFLARHRAIRFASLIAVCSITFSGWVSMHFSFDKEFQARSFFGIYRVGVNHASKMRFLSHGTTVHGAQSIVAAYRHEPQTYYLPNSGIGRVMRSAQAQSVGVVGLGSGALACYAKPGQAWTFYEIDPLVVRIAKDTSLFTYLSDCTPHAVMAVGDARLKLRDSGNAAYDLLVIDAFSSDSIPLHLITAEAFDLYRARLRPDGLLMVHISNRYMDLQPVIANIAHAQGWQAWRFTNRLEDEKETVGRYPTKSMWVMLAPSKAVADAQFARMPGGAHGWVHLDPMTGQRIWTDNYSNTLSVLKWLQ